MKTIARQITNSLMLSILMGISGVSAQATRVEPGDTTAYERPFDISMFMSPDWKLNVMLNVRQAGRVTITLKRADNTVLYQEYVKKASTRYRRRFNFEGSEPGVYQFEISDGQKTIVRRVEVVNIPAVGPQRYMTYGPQIGL